MEKVFEAPLLKQQDPLKSEVKREDLATSLADCVTQVALIRRLPSTRSSIYRCLQLLLNNFLLTQTDTRRKQTLGQRTVTEPERGRRPGEQTDILTKEFEMKGS